MPEQIKHTFEDILNSDGILVYTNVGYSMMPLLHQRKDVIEIRKKEDDRCNKYDVVLYKRGDHYILHRVLKVMPEGYIIAGDHNTCIDGLITDDMVIGVMTRVIRSGRSITPDNILYKLYIHLWCDAYPIRMLLQKIIRSSKSFIYRCLRFVKRRVFRL